MQDLVSRSTNHIFGNAIYFVFQPDNNNTMNFTKETYFSYFYDLAKNELFKRDVKRIIGYLTPYVPMVRLISGGITVGAHVADKKFNILNK